MNDKKIKASELLKELVIYTENNLSLEDSYIFQQLNDINQLFIERYENIVLSNLQAFNRKQQLSIMNLFNLFKELYNANMFKISEYYRFAYIRCIIDCGLKNNIVDLDIDMEKDFKNIVLQIIPDCNYYKK